MPAKGCCVAVDASKLRLSTCRAQRPRRVPLSSAHDRTAELEREVERERALRAKAEDRVAKLMDETCRLRKRINKLLGATRLSGLQNGKKLLRRLLLEFHPDKSGGDAVFTSTAVSQKITELLQEQA